MQCLCLEFGLVLSSTAVCVVYVPAAGHTVLALNPCQHRDASQAVQTLSCSLQALPQRPCMPPKAPAVGPGAAQLLSRTEHVYCAGVRSGGWRLGEQLWPPR